MPIDDRTHDQLERRLADVDLAAYVAARRAVAPYHPSPVDWQDQVLYFLLLDRFSDGREGAPGRPPFAFAADAYRADRRGWLGAGDGWCGGTLAGLRGKLGYLQRLGVTTIWVSPVFKQTPTSGSYHGYAIQNFLDVDPHFGTRRDLKDLVDEAHRLGLYVILDVIINHTGDVFAYTADRPWALAWDGTRYPVRGFRDALGQPTLPLGDVSGEPGVWPDGAVWPAELQSAATFTRRGEIRNWDYDPEYLEGDFYSLKDIDHGFHLRDPDGARLTDHFERRPALDHLVEVLKFWITYADVDGFRIDTVKHLERGATRFLVVELKEYAATLGKENFFLLGEITGGRAQAFDTLEQTGLDAALGIDEVSDKLEFLAKGYRDPQEYFGLFRNSVLMNKGSHTWYGRHVVTMFDDHDKVGRAKVRFCGDRENDPASKDASYRALPVALALNLLTSGIPCLYYGSEQAFDGAQWRWEREADGHDDERCLRECMFGGAFGSQQSTGRHFFDESHPVYRLVATLAAERRGSLALRRGRQYLRDISDGGAPGTFGPPALIGGEIRSIVPWSRLFGGEEVVVAVNTDVRSRRAAWVTVDRIIHPPGSRLRCRYATDPADIGRGFLIEDRNGAATRLSLPPAGCAIFV
jgi:glycosidase